MLFGDDYSSSAAWLLSGLSAGYHGNVALRILGAKSAFCLMQAAGSGTSLVSRVTVKPNAEKISVHLKGWRNIPQNEITVSFVIKDREQIRDLS